MLPVHTVSTINPRQPLERCCAEHTGAKNFELRTGDAHHRRGLAKLACAVVQYQIDVAVERRYRAASRRGVGLPRAIRARQRQRPGSKPQDRQN